MKFLLKTFFVIVTALLVVSCSSSRTTTTSSSKAKSSKTTKPVSSSKSSSSTGGLKVGAVTTGQASYYADKFHGNPTASGEKYNKKALTCAHKTYPFGTMLKVTNKANGKSVTVKVNDRGPFKAGRIVDLSSAAADKIDMKKAGVIDVKVEIVSLP